MSSDFLLMIYIRVHCTLKPCIPTLLSAQRIKYGKYIISRYTLGTQTKDANIRNHRMCNNINIQIDNRYIFEYRKQNMIRWIT